MTSTTARQRSIIAAEKAKSAAAVDAAKKETDARDADITVVATSYDAVTGDWVASTPDGGTVRAQSLTNGSLSGLRLPLQRFPGSQTARINAPPTDADSGWVVSEIESSQRDMFGLLGRDKTTGGVESPSLRHYTVVLDNDARRRVESLTIENRNPDDTLGTAGAGTLKINGVAVVLGTTVLEVEQRLAIEITNVGTGSLFWSVNFTRV